MHYNSLEENWFKLSFDTLYDAFLAQSYINDDVDSYGDIIWENKPTGKSS